MKKIVIAITLMMMVALPTFAKPSAKSKISKERARTIALERAPGKVLSEELEQEKGILVWSFDIQSGPQKITEVWVDANDGRIVAVEDETPAKERAEKAKEKAEKNKRKGVHGSNAGNAVH